MDNRKDQGTPDNTHEVLGAFTSMGMALCYVFMFVVYGVLLPSPASQEVGDIIAFLTENALLLAVTNGVGYLLFGCLLLVTVQSVHKVIHTGFSILLNSASVFGVLWVGLMMCAGMIELIAMHKVSELSLAGSEQAVPLFYAASTIANALGGGIEIVGGLWVLLLSIAGLRAGTLSKGVHILGIWVGIFGVLTLLHTVSELKEVFGLSQILWFVWLGVALLKYRNIRQ